MIEQIDGTGLTGTLGKSSKQGKGSLFAKLFAMFDKRAEASGKSKGLQIQGWQPAQGKSLTANQQGVTPALAVKGKHILTTPNKGKELDTHDAIAAAMQGIHQLATDQTKIKSGSGQSEDGETVAMAMQKKADQKKEAGKQNIGQHQVADTKVGKQPLNQAKGDNEDETDLNTRAQTGLKTAGSESAQAAANVKQQNVTATQTATGKSADTENGSEKATLQMNQVADAKAVAGKENKAATSAAGKTETQDTIIQQGQFRMAAANQQDEWQTTQNATATKPAQFAKLSGDQEANIKPESSPVATPLHAKQAQAAQPQHNAAVTAAATATVAASTAGQESMQSDAGTQQGEEGSREARFISSLSGDARANQTQQNSGTTFQSFLQGKAPSMSLFDSMNHIAQSASNGKTKLEIQLEPASLGKIQVTLQTDASKQLQIHMVVDQGATRAAIEQQLPALRNALAQQGFDLSGFSMGSNGNQKEGFAGNEGRSSSHHYANADHGNSNSEMMQASSTYNTRSADGGLSIHI